MWREGLDAAEYALTHCEWRLDQVLGRELRLAIGRYASLFFLGVPVAWMLNDFHWTHTATLGLASGMFLYAVIDITKRATAKRPPL